MHIALGRPLRLIAAAATAYLVFLPQRGSAVDTVSIRIADAVFEGGSARGITISLDSRGRNTVARVSAARVILSEALGPLEAVTLTCLNPLIRPPVFRCHNARIAGMLGKLGKQSFTADIDYERSRESLVFKARDLRFGGGVARIEGRWLGSRQTLELRAGVENLTINNTAGTLATDKLGFTVEARVMAEGDDWEIDAALRSSKGQAYSDPVFVDFGVSPMAMRLRGRWLHATNTLRIGGLEIDQKGVVKASAAGVVNLTAMLGPPPKDPGTTNAPMSTPKPALIQSLQVALEALEFPGAYTTLLQPFLIDTALKEMEMSGRLSGSLTLSNDAPVSIDLTLQDVTARDTQGKLGIQGLYGKVAWHSRAPLASAAASHLTWKAANAYGLSGGTARIDFKAAGRDFELLKPTLLPVFDGGLQLQTLSLKALGSPNPSLAFDAELRPISLSHLSRAFGWPEFGGTLAGRIPQASYDNHILSVGGALEAQAFGGHVRVDGLRLREPLGRYPRLNADVTLRGLDLQAITGTFSFGMITGRLDGDVRDLELFLWEPVRMDARLYTPPNDRSRHLISQRAVKNLSSIGGGGSNVAAALSSGFLKFFENFRYQKLGLSCRLQNGVCQMDGIARAGGVGDTYYIVKGSGIPRIDIIGNSRRVDWPTLVEQLKAASQSEGPVVQ